MLNVNHNYRLRSCSYKQKVNVNGLNATVTFCHSESTSASTTAGLSAARFFETTSPGLLKICSLGTDVGGAANTLAARFRKRGYRFSFSFDSTTLTGLPSNQLVPRC